MTVALSFEIKSSLFTKRGHAKLLRRINRDLMQKIATRYWPKHFQQVPETVPGSGGYRYQRRTAKYQLRKQRQVGHQIPNVLTGELRRHVLNNFQITATQHRATLKARGPRPLNAARRQELQVVSRREVQELIKEQKADYLRLAKTDEYQEHRRRRAGARGA